MLLEEKDYELGNYDRSDEYNVLIASVSSSLIHTRSNRRSRQYRNT